ncbi:MAG: membrane integrity-associated transporter subunit PqiC [Deltaproteobacteria bacterium]|nr:membrane integrity-associated transporter subunit PqiC [Deltaproteobacteria bacterium]
MGRFTSRAAGIVAGLLLTGCLGRTPAPVFYTLTVVEPTVTTAAGGADGPVLAIGPAILPSYLDRPQLVSRQGNRVSYAQYSRWAAPLESELLRVMGANLGSLLRTNRVVVYPAEPRLPVAFRIRLQVEQFDGSPGGEVVLNVRWAIARPSSKEPDVIGASEIRQPVAGSEDDDLVDAHSQAVGALSREIAERIRSLSD